MSETPNPIGPKFDVPRFDGTGNFARWQVRMEDLLTTLGLWDTLQETKPTEHADRVHRKKPAVSEKEGEKFKARLVAKSYSQQNGVDYYEIFSPVVRHTSIRAVLALVASHDMILEQMDVKTGFLHGKIEEQIYMEQLEGFEETGPRPVCKLKRSLYGLKQSPGQWHKRFNGFVLKMGCRRCDYVCCVCVRSLDGRDSIFLLLYDDEILRYLRGTRDWNIMFSREQSVPSVAWYVDSDYVGDRDDRRSTTGYVFTLTGGPICWKSSVQPIVAMSRTEAEYMAVAEAAMEAL